MKIEYINLLFKRTVMKFKKQLLELKMLLIIDGFLPEDSIWNINLECNISILGAYIKVSSGIEVSDNGPTTDNVFNSMYQHSVQFVFTN